jgi:hypothetical protein
MEKSTPIRGVAQALYGPYDVERPGREAGINVITISKLHAAREAICRGMLGSHPHLLIGESDPDYLKIGESCGDIDSRPVHPTARIENSESVFTYRRELGNPFISSEFSHL